MNEHLKFKVLQLCSGHYLSANIPNNWHELSEEQQNNFLIENVWEPLEHNNPELIWSAIDSAADATYNFIQDLQDKSSRSIIWSTEDIQGFVDNEYEKNISEEHAAVVLQHLEDTYSPSVGITWDIIYTAVEHLLEEEKISIGGLE